MTTKRICFFSFMLLTLATTGCGTKEESAGQARAPSAKSSPTLDQVAGKAPAVLYFVKKDCGSNPAAIPLVQAVYAANSESGRFYAVMNADAATAAKWSQDNKTTFPIIPDPDKKIIGKYGIPSSQTAIVVDKDLKETKRFEGYGLKSLEDMNASLAAGGEAAKVDLSTAPPAGSG